MPANSWRVPPENVFVTCAWVVSTKGDAGAVTSTVVVASPTSNVKDPKPTSVPAVTATLFCARVLNPFAVISTVYVPTGKRLNRNRPELSLVVAVTTPVSTFLAFTSALATTAPDLSTTVPEIEPLMTCAADGRHHTSVRTTAARTIIFRSFELILFSIFYELRNARASVDPCTRCYSGLLQSEFHKVGPFESWTYGGSLCGNTSFRIS